MLRETKSLLATFAILLCILIGCEASVLIQPPDVTSATPQVQVSKEVLSDAIAMTISFQYAPVGTNPSPADSLGVTFVTADFNRLSVGADRSDYDSIAWPGDTFLTTAPGFYSGIVTFEAPLSRNYHGSEASLSASDPWQITFFNSDFILGNGQSANWSNITLTLFLSGEIAVQPDPAPPPEPSSSSGSTNVGLIVGVVIGGVAGLALIVALALVLARAVRRRRSRSSYDFDPNTGPISHTYI